jgi:probable HAF family extracellular repeat protein
VKAATVSLRTRLVLQRAAQQSLSALFCRNFRQRPGLGQTRAVGLVAGTALLLLPLVWAPLTLAQEVHPQYTVVDRGPALVRTLTDTPGLNNHGDMVIWHSETASLMPGVLFHGKETISIEGEKNFTLVYPSDINDRLTVVGTLQIPQDLRFTQAFKWSDNKLEFLESLGGPYSSALAVNAAGDVVGSAQVSSGEKHAVLWRTKQPRDLGLLAQGNYSRARDINDKDDVVGEANVALNGKPQAFLWRAGKMQQLPNLPGGSLCNAQAINNSGVIVGSCDLASGTSHGVIWRNGSVEDLGALHDADSPSTALDINSLGQVVGTSGDDRPRAFLWEKGKMINLNKLIAPDSGWTLLVASRINENGEIIGRGYFHRTIHAFMLQPLQPDQAFNKK